MMGSINKPSACLQFAVDPFILHFEPLIIFTAFSSHQLLRSEPPKLSQKIRVFYKSFANCLLAMCVIIFLIGMGLRFFQQTRGWGRVIYSLDIVLWYLQLFNILSVNMYLGTLVNMIGKMVSHRNENQKERERDGERDVYFNSDIVAIKVCIQLLLPMVTFFSPTESYPPLFVGSYGRQVI